MLPTLFIVVNNIVEPESGVSMLNNVVDNIVNNMDSTTLFNPVFNNIAKS